MHEVAQRRMYAPALALLLIGATGVPESSKELTAEKAEHIRQKVEDAEFEVRRQKVKMTVSIGVASMPEDALDIEGIVDKADQALYRAKREGRNRVCVSEA